MAISHPLSSADVIRGSKTEFPEMTGAGPGKTRGGKCLRTITAILLSFCFLTMVKADNNEIEAICVKAKNCFMHFWAIYGGSGHKCQPTINEFEEHACTVKCKNITSRMYCNSENKKCQWVDIKDASGAITDGVCKRKTEFKSFKKKPEEVKKPKAKASTAASDGGASTTSAAKKSLSFGKKKTTADAAAAAG